MVKYAILERVYLKAYDENAREVWCKGGSSWDPANGDCVLSVSEGQVTAKLSGFIKIFNESGSEIASRPA